MQKLFRLMILKQVRQGTAGNIPGSSVERPRDTRLLKEVRPGNQMME